MSCGTACAADGASGCACSSKVWSVCGVIACVAACLAIFAASVATTIALVSDAAFVAAAVQAGARFSKLTSVDTAVFPSKEAL